MFGPIELLTSDKLIDDLYSEEVVSTDEIDKNYPVNQYFVLRSNQDEKKTVLAKLNKDKNLEKIISRNDFNLCGIKPKDSKQVAFTQSLISDDILMPVCIGNAGTGKTTLAVAYALDQHFQNGKTIYLSKPTRLVSSSKNNAFGPIPGDVQEKFAPHIDSFITVMNKITGERGVSYLEVLIKKQAIRFVPVEYTRGNTYEDCVFILDEVQNLTWHELKTVVSRLGENSKLILLGDPFQIDAKMSLQETGIYYMLASNSFRESPLTSCIRLTKQYRGPIAQLVADIDNEESNNQYNKRGFSIQYNRYTK